MKLLLNVVWFLFGGLEMGLAWICAGLTMCCTIIGIPLGVQCFKMARLVMLPLGTEVKYEFGIFRGLINIIWIILIGWLFALFSVLIGLLWCLTIIGIPIGLQWFKIAKLSFMPFGTDIR